MSTASDVYSFGVILLELITGEMAIIKDTSGVKSHITERVTQRNIESIVDQRLQASSYSIDSVRKAFATAMVCVENTKVKRSNISWVYSQLEDALKIEKASEGIRENEYISQ